MGPKDVAFGAQGGVGTVLFWAGVCVFYDPGEGEVGILGSLRQATGEIIEAVGEPGIMLAHAVHPKSDEFVREEFGERRSDSFEVRTSGNEIDIGLNGEARRGENSITPESLFACEARGFHEAQPLLDAAGPGAVAVVIEDAFAPGDSECGVFAAREDGGVFDGDTALIVIAIERPGLKLAASELAFVHQQMKWVPVVVAFFTDGVKAGDEFGFGEQRLFDDVIRGRGHRVNSIPS